MNGYLELPGCRHDILGHYIKASGLLRVLAKCADETHRDTDAEGWWDSDKACQSQLINIPTGLGKTAPSCSHGCSFVFAAIAGRKIISITSTYRLNYET